MDNSELIDVAIEYIPRNAIMWTYNDELAVFQWDNQKRRHKFIIRDLYTHFTITDRTVSTYDMAPPPPFLDIRYDRTDNETLVRHIKLRYTGVMFLRGSLTDEER